LEPTIIQANSYFEEKRYEEAVDICNKILSVNSNSLEAYKLIAKIFLTLGQVENSQTYLKRAFNIYPNDCELIKDLGNTYKALGDVILARDYYHNRIIDRLFKQAKARAWASIKDDPRIAKVVEEQRLEKLRQVDKRQTTANILNIYK